MGENGKNWYMVHTYSGYEDKVKANLEQRIKSMNTEDEIFQIVVPTEKEIEIKDGKRREVDKKLFPGYVFVQMKMSERSWNVVRNTPRVTGFVSTQDEQGKLIPSAVKDEEAEAILERMRSGVPRVKVGFSKGQSVRITEGPFTDFMGIVDDISPEKGKLKVLVSFFGRETPVELDFLQVERL